MPNVIHLHYVHVKVGDVKLNVSSPETRHCQSRTKGRSFTVSAVPQSMGVSRGLTSESQADSRRILLERE